MAAGALLDISLTSSAATEMVSMLCVMEATGRLSRKVAVDPVVLYVICAERGGGALQRQTSVRCILC